MVSPKYEQRKGGASLTREIVQFEDIRYGRQVLTRFHVEAKLASFAGAPLCATKNEHAEDEAPEQDGYRMIKGAIFVLHFGEEPGPDQEIQKFHCFNRQANEDGGDQDQQPWNLSVWQQPIG